MNTTELRELLDQVAHVARWEGTSNGHDGTPLVFHLRTKSGQVAGVSAVNASACVWDLPEDFANAIQEVTGRAVGASRMDRLPASEAPLVSQGEVDALRPTFVRGADLRGGDVIELDNAPGPVRLGVRERSELDGIVFSATCDDDDRITGVNIAPQANYRVTSR